MGRWSKGFAGMLLDQDIMCSIMQSLGHFCAALSSIVWRHSMTVACGFLSFVPTCNQPASKEGDERCTDHIMYSMTVTLIHCMTGTQKLHRCCQGCSRQHPQQTAQPASCRQKGLSTI